MAGIGRGERSVAEEGKGTTGSKDHPPLALHAYSGFGVGYSNESSSSEQLDSCK